MNRFNFSLARFTPYRRRLTRSLRLRLLVLVGSVLLLTLLVSVATTITFVYQTEVRAWQGRQGEAVHYAADTVAAFAQRVEDTLRWASLMDRADVEQKPQLLRDLIRQNMALLEILRVDAGGQIVADAYQDQPLLAQPAAQSEIRDLMAQVATGNTDWDWRPFPGSRERVLLMALRGSAGGAVVGRVRMDVLEQVVTNIRFGQTGRAYVVSRAGQIIAHTNRALMATQLNLQNNPALEPMFDAPGNEWFGAYTKLNCVWNPTAGCGWR